MAIDDPLVLRPARPGDAPVLAALAGQLGYPTDAGAMAQRLQVLLADTQHRIVVATRQGDVFGWADAARRMTLEGGERVELVGLVVDERSRGQGAGGALLAEVERWAAACGTCELVVRSNVIRERAHAFYARHGFARRKSQHVHAKALR